MRYDFIIYTDYDGKVKSGLVPRKHRVQNEKR